jgi:integrase
MYERVKVSVVEFGDRRHYQMQWRDSITRRKKTKSTGVERTGRKKEHTEAERVAAKFEAELREGRYHEPLKVTWAEFRDRYELEVLPGLADRTDGKVASVFNWVERVLKPTRLVDLTEARLSHLQAAMRRTGLAEATIKSNLAHLGAALKWGARIGLMTRAPKILMPRRAKGAKVMKGRPVTGEEFDRMLEKVPAVAGEGAAPSWRYYLQGLWWSGLRLEESLELWWDRDDRLCVDLSGEHPMLRIPGELEKGNQDRLLPMAPEFAGFLLATPEAERTGPVFDPRPKRVKGQRLTAHRVGELVAQIGKAAGIKVHTDPKTGKVKYASAHDLRRSFGERWATRIMPPDLMVLMRHESIETTLRYYVGRNAQNTAKTLWQAMEKATNGNTSGNRAAESSSANEETLPQSVDTTGFNK